MKLLSLEFKNLFSLGEGKIDLDNRGLTLITGYSHDEGSANGAGKSSLANKAILWSLFGETAGGLKADSVLNRHGKRKGFGKLVFETNEIKYRIERYRPNKLLLFKEETDISASTSKTTQQLIDKLLGFDFKTFLQTSVFGQGKLIHYPNLSPKEQKAILEQILPIDEINRWADYADKNIKILNPKLKEKELEVYGLNEKISTLENELQRCEKNGIEFEQNRQEKIQVAEAALKGVKDKFKSELETLELLKTQIKSVEEKDIKEEIIELESKIELLNTAIKQIESSHNHAISIEIQWSSNLRMLLSQKTNLDTATKCPTCLRDYDEAAIKTTQLALNALNNDIKKAEENKNQSLKAINYYKEELNNQSKEKEKCEQHISSLKTKLDLKQKYTNEKSNLYSRIDAASATFQAQLDTAKAAENPHTNTFQQVSQDLKLAKTNMEKTDKQYSILKDEVDHLLYWRDVYGKELKIKLFEDVCPFLDSRTNYHLNQLKNSQIHCDFSTIKRLSNGDTKEDFNVVVWSETGGRGFESLSGGEQQIVNFAIGLSLADLATSVVGSKSGFLILDEPLTELDERNSEAVVEYLTSEIGNGRDTIFLISNEDSLKGLIHNRIHVVKSNGVSNVVNQ